MFSNAQKEYFSFLVSWSIIIRDKNPYLTRRKYIIILKLKKKSAFRKSLLFDGVEAGEL